MSIVYAYSIARPLNDLKELASQLKEPIFWSASLTDFQIGKGLPKEWLDQGSVFDRTAELRWQTVGEIYNILIFADQKWNGLDSLEGKWQSSEEEIFLQDLNEPKVRPLFKKYPHGAVSGSLKVKICKRDGVIVGISPREILSEEGFNEG